MGYVAAAGLMPNGFCSGRRWNGSVEGSNTQVSERVTVPGRKASRHSLKSC